MKENAKTCQEMTACKSIFRLAALRGMGYTERENKKKGMGPLPWYWILIIASAVIGPFEAYYVINKAWQRKKEREKKQQESENERK